MVDVEFAVLANALDAIVVPTTKAAEVFGALLLIPVFQVNAPTDGGDPLFILTGHLLLIPLLYYLVRFVWGFLFPDVFPVQVVDEENPVGYRQVVRLYRSGRKYVSRSWVGDRWNSAQYWAGSRLRSAQYRWGEFQFSRSPGGRRARWSEVYRHRLRGRIHTRNSPGWWRNRGRP